jgi:uncharacterized protein (DUF1697 family)
MSIWIALFRGINVGGHGRLPMKELVPLLEELGLFDPRSVIQSGNVVFGSRRRSAASLSRAIEDAVEASHGFRPAVLVLDRAGFLRRLEANPYPEAAADPKSLHLFFAARPPERPDLDGLENLRAGRERWTLDRDVFYLNAPDGIGRSKLAAGVEKRLGVPTTARNWNTLQRLRALLGA